MQREIDAYEEEKSSFTSICSHTVQKIELHLKRENGRKKNSEKSCFKWENVFNKKIHEKRCPEGKKSSKEVSLESMIVQKESFKRW